MDHFKATQKITSFLKCAWTHHVNLTMIASEAMEPWQNTIRAIYGMSHSGAKEEEEIIHILDKIICMQATPSSIFVKFRTPEAGTYIYNARPHCEILLVALREFGGGVEGTEAVRHHLEVWVHFSYRTGVYKFDAWHRILMTA